MRAKRGTELTMKKKVQPADDGEMAELQHEEQHHVMQGAKSVIFNLNTIEFFTLGSTVMVNLSGIMLLSGQFENLDENSEYQRDLITYTILFIIFTSFLYLGIAFLREIQFARSIGTDFVRARWRAAIRKQILINRRKKTAGRKFQDVVYQVMRKHNVGTYAGSLAILNKEEVENRQSQTGPLQSGFFGGFGGFGKKGAASSGQRKPLRRKKKDKAAVAPVTGGNQQVRKDSLWDEGPSANEILPASAVQPFQTVEDTDEPDLY